MTSAGYAVYCGQLGALPVIATVCIQAEPTNTPCTARNGIAFPRRPNLLPVHLRLGVLTDCGRTRGR